MGDVWSAKGDGGIGLVIWDIVKPPSGKDARRVVMAFTLVLVVGRAGLLSLVSPQSAARINFMSQWQYAFAFGVLFLALILTRDGRRVSWFGFATSAVGFGLYTMQAVDVWPVIPASGYYWLMSVTLLTEAAMIWRLLHVRR